MGRDAGGTFLRTRAPVSREIPVFGYSQCPDHRSEVLFAVSLLRGPREKRLHEGAEPQLHAELAGLVQAVAHVLQHVLELEEAG